MDNILQRYLAYLIFPVIACFLALILTRVCVSLLPAFGLMDVPGGRHIHKKITPKGGGIAIIISFIAAWFCFSVSPWNYYIGEMSITFLRQIAVPGGLIIFIGLLDDRYNIRARYKLLGQIGVGVLCWYFGIKFTDFFDIQFSSWVSCIVTTIWIVGFINAFNLIDGMDGLAAGLGIVSSVCMAVIFIFQHTPTNVVVMLCFAGACLGFLYYNFHPARIFMGDTGSMFLGFMMAVVGILTTTKLATFSAVSIPLLAAGVPVFDVFLAIWRRTARKILRKQSGETDENHKIMSGDKEHLHHRILDRNNSQAKATLVIYAFAVVFACIAVALVVFKDQTKGLAFIIVLGTFVAAIRRLATIELWNSAKVLVNGIHQPKRGVLVALAHPFIDTFFLTISFMVSYYLFNNFIWNSLVIQKLLLSTCYNILPALCLLHIGGAYKRFWFKASASDYKKIFELLFIGHMINVAIQYKFFYVGDIKLFVAECLIFTLTSSFLIVGERMSLRYLKSNMMRNLYMNQATHIKSTKVLLYGGGMRCRFFLNEKFGNIESDPIEIVGLVDDSIALRGQYVYGQKVLGCYRDLEKIFEKKRFEKIIVSSPKISSNKKKIVKGFCRRHKVKLSELVFEEREVSKDRCEKELFTEDSKESEGREE